MAFTCAKEKEFRGRRVYEIVVKINCEVSVHLEINVSLSLVFGIMSLSCKVYNGINFGQRGIIEVVPGIYFFNASHFACCTRQAENAMFPRQLGHKILTNKAMQACNKYVHAIMLNS